jgi:hypothetical protein
MQRGSQPKGKPAPKQQFEDEDMEDTYSGFGGMMGNRSRV